MFKNLFKSRVQKSVSLPELLFTFSRTAAVFQNWDVDTAINEGLKASAIFYACVQKRAQAFAQVPWMAKKKTTLEEDPNSELQKIIDNPNPDISWSEMMEHLVYFIDLAGNNYWSIIRAGNVGKPVGLWPLAPHGMKITPGPTTIIESYQPKGRAAKILSRDMVHIKTINPESFLFGLPTIQAAGRAIDIDRMAGEWQMSSLQNRGISDYAIVIDPETTPETVERLRELHKSRNAGPQNARAPFLTTRDIKPLNQSAVEMDFVASRSKVWAEIATAMGVPLPMIGVLDNATLANIETSRKIFWLDSIVPLLRMVRGQLNQQLAIEYPGMVIDYDLSGVEALREDYQKKVDAAQKLWMMGVPFNTINEVLELEVGDIKGGDVGYIGAGVLPTDFDFNDQPESAALANMTIDEMKRLAYGK